MWIKTVIRYDQAPWDREHILALYTIEPSDIRTDSQWHPLPTEGQEVAYYRVYRESYFQYVCSSCPSHLLSSIMEIEPVPTADDAEWFIYEIEGSNLDGLWLSSNFAISPGPFDYHYELNDWLRELGLFLLPCEYHVRGVVHLREISTVTLQQAMQRLTWLEGVLITLNRRIEKLGKRLWRQIKRDTQNPEALKDPYTGLPMVLPHFGSKYREPI